MKHPELTAEVEDAAMKLLIKKVYELAAMVKERDDRIASLEKDLARKEGGGRRPLSDRDLPYIAKIEYMEANKAVLHASDSDGRPTAHLKEEVVGASWSEAVGVYRIADGPRDFLVSERRLNRMREEFGLPALVGRARDYTCLQRRGGAVLIDRDGHAIPIVGFGSKRGNIENCFFYVADERGERGGVGGRQFRFSKEEIEDAKHLTGIYWLVEDGGQKVVFTTSLLGEATRSFNLPKPKEPKENE